MPDPVVTSLGSNSASGTTCSISGAVLVVGQDVLVGFVYDAGSLTGVSDDLGNSYSAVSGLSTQTVPGTSNKAIIYRAKVTVGGTATITVTTGGAGDISMGAVKIDNLDPSPIDQTNNGTDSSSPFGNLLGVTPGTPLGVAIAFLAGNGTTSPDTHAGSPFTIDNERTNGGPDWTCCLAHLNYNTNTTINPSFTSATSTTAAFLIVTLKGVPTVYDTLDQTRDKILDGESDEFELELKDKSWFDWDLVVEKWFDEWIPTPSGSGTTYFQTVDGALGFTGALQKQTNKQVAGTLSFVGALQKQTNKGLAGVLSFGGALQKQTNKLLAGVLSFNGALAAQVVRLQSLAGSLSFSGALQKQTNKQLAGALSFVGTLQKQTNKQLAGVLSFVGTLTRSHIFQQVLSGVLSFAGTLGTLFTPGGGAVTRWFHKRRSRRDLRF